MIVRITKSKKNLNQKTLNVSITFVFSVILFYFLDIRDNLCHIMDNFYM